MANSQLCYLVLLIPVAQNRHPGRFGSSISRRWCYIDWRAEMAGNTGRRCHSQHIGTSAQSEGFNRLKPIIPLTDVALALPATIGARLQPRAAPQIS